MAENDHVVVPVDPNDLDPIRETGIALSENQIAHAAVVDQSVDAEEHWLNNVYQGDKVPQLTLRAVLMGGTLGVLMSVSNLYTSIKVGWAFGVAITACVLSYVIWNSFRLINPKITPMSILENNCMQSTASAAGYSTGATIGTAFGALLLITHKHVEWPIMLAWTTLTAALGVFLAVPMKRQMINKEQLTFPSGVAAAETLKSLYGQSKESINQAKALVALLASGMIVGFLGKGDFEWQKKLGLKIPDMINFQGSINGANLSKMPGFGFEPSLLLIGAGMIVGLRVCFSMLLGSALLYFVIGPIMLARGEILEPSKLLKWSLWTGTALMVSSGLTAFAVQWKTIVRSFTSLKAAAKTDDLTSVDAASSVHQISVQERLAAIEVPMKWLFIGLVPLLILMVGLEYIAFSINPGLGVLSVVMSFFLALVACRATGETDITPIGAMGKLTQLAYSVLAPSNITTNLMAGSVTANIAISSADLLVDLKSGYLLGANPRQQFFAQFIGLFFGSLAVVPAWYLMIPNWEALEKYNPPSAHMWQAVAEALAHGISYIPELARWGLLVGGILGIVLALIDAYAPKKLKPFLPSAMGIGLSWVMPFSNCFSFFMGALLAYIWQKANSRSAELYVVPVASGAIAGESLMCAVIAMITAIGALNK
ncbi:MAG: OPT/YSL family transporter [Candidatus Obscuribacterales bacterium]|nr:OPT/YSL family transporter [Candidatus Obscuribacterales bacterium]